MTPDLCLILFRFIIDICSTSVRTGGCSQTWTGFEQHEVGAVASKQKAVDGKSPLLQHPETSLSGHSRCEVQLTPSEGDGAHHRRQW